MSETKKTTGRAKPLSGNSTVKGNTFSKGGKVTKKTTKCK